MNPIFRIINGFFDALDKVVNVVQGGITTVWNGFRDHILHHVLFFLIIGFTGVIVVFKAILEEADRLIAGFERGIIAISLMVMSILYFLMYFNREAIPLGLPDDALAKWTVTLMVWVGFLGASLATRRRSHLAVDATDRILSPKAARLVKRLTAVAAAVFCWHFADFARETVDESLFEGGRLEALPLLDWMVGPLNVLGQILFNDGGLTNPAQLFLGAILLGVIAESRRQRKAAYAQLPPTLPDEDPPEPPFSGLRTSLDVVAGIGLAYLLLSVAGDRWDPINSDGEEYIWTDLQTSEQLAAQNAQETQEQMDFVQDMGLEVGSLEDLTTYGDVADFGDTGVDTGAGASNAEQDAMIERNRRIAMGLDPDETADGPSIPTSETLSPEPTEVDLQALIGEEVPVFEDEDEDEDDENEVLAEDQATPAVDEAAIQALIGEEVPVFEDENEDEDEDDATPVMDEAAIQALIGGEVPVFEDEDENEDEDDENEVLAEDPAKTTMDDVELQALIGGGDVPDFGEDTGAPVATEAPPANTVTKPKEAADSLVGNTSVDTNPDTDEPTNSTATVSSPQEESVNAEDIGQEFPRWFVQTVLPLSFILMAIRFAMIAFFGRFEETQPDMKTAGTAQKPSDSKGARDLIVAGLIPGLLIGISAALGMDAGPLIFLTAILLLLMGAPLFLLVGVATVACVTMITDDQSLLVMDAFGKDVLIPPENAERSPATQIVIDMFEAVKKEELLAIPFFVLAGNIMTQGSIAERLVGVAKAFMGKTPGGLGLATIAACVIFAAISGSSPVTVIAVGGIMFPMLMRDRYPENYSVGVLTSAGSLGIIIPPSVPMIIYAIVVGMSLSSVSTACTLSPNDLFLAGVLPGLFIAMVLVVYTLHQTRPGRAGLDIQQPELDGGYWPNLAKELRRSIPSLMLPILILGGIYGILGPLRFTVTEAAAVAVIYALFVELVINRELKLTKLPKVFADSGVMMGGLFLIIVLAIAFNKFLTGQQVPQEAAIWLQSQIDSKLEFLLLVNLFLLALGCVMDIISAILIVAPLLAPIALSFGIDPVHFGIMFIVNLELGYLTPPMGINLFVSSTVFKRGIIQVIRATAPFFFLMLFCLGVISMAPSLSTSLLGADTQEASDACVDAVQNVEETATP